jgi:hypothetical protein
MRLATEMTVEEFEAWLAKSRAELTTIPERHDVNRKWRNPKWRSAVISAHTARRSMQRRHTK